MKAEMWNYREWVTETDSRKLKLGLDKILEASGFGILKFVEHEFEPQGYTALWLLSESHLAVHTFPEEHKSYIELTSCVKKYYENFIPLFEGCFERTWDADNDL